jgi:sugar/nucleoside kinase (ribokinase family)
LRPRPGADVTANGETHEDGNGQPAAGRGPAAGASRAGHTAPRIAVVGVHILDVLGRPVEAIPAGQGSVRLDEIRATVAGTAVGTAVDLGKLGARVRSFGAIGADLLGDILLLAMSAHGVDTSGLIRTSAPRRQPPSCRSERTESGPRCTCPARAASRGVRHRPGRAARQRRAAARRAGRCQAGRWQAGRR